MTLKHNASWGNTIANNTISQIYKCILIVFILFECLLLLSCEEFVKIDSPKTQIVTQTVYTDDATATSAIRGIYSKIMESPNIVNYDATRFGGLLADELDNYLQDQNQAQFYNNSLTSANPTVNSLWSSAYGFIYHANSVLEGLAGSQNISEPTRKQLEGEAKFVRAFLHFYLVNFWSDVPLVLTTDYRVNAVVSRTNELKVYEAIVSDLQDAQNLLTEDYVTTGRVRPNKFTATALLARVYLYMGDWVNAEAQSSAIIDNSSYDLLADLNGVFLKDSKEAIWQLMPVISGVNTFEGNSFIISSTPSELALSEKVIDDFESNDKRLDDWVGSSTVDEDTYYYPFKYKVQNGSPASEYLVVFRLAEQYLIRAEARAKQDKITEAISDVDVIRQRAGLALISVTNPSIDKSGTLLAIEQERRIELFAEWGHRWLDLKRTSRANSVLGSSKSGWDPNDVLLPLPRTEMINNPNLKPQNTGY